MARALKLQHGINLMEKSIVDQAIADIPEVRLWAQVIILALYHEIGRRKHPTSYIKESKRKYLVAMYLDLPDALEKGGSIEKICEFIGVDIEWWRAKWPKFVDAYTK